MILVESFAQCRQDFVCARGAYVFYLIQTTFFFCVIEQQKLLNKDPKKLIQDVQTRWNSTYYMLERFTELEVPLRTTMALVDKDLPIISLEEWDFFKEIVTILKPLEAITKEMSGQNYVIASLVIILTDGLLEIYRDFKNNSDFLALSKGIVNSILEEICVRLGDLENSNSLLITTFLDPRFKTVGFSSENISERAKKNCNIPHYRKY